MGLILRWAYYSGLLASTSLAALMCMFNGVIHGAVDPLAAASFGIHMQLLYLGDRLAGNAEDRALRETSPARHVQAHRRLFIALALLLAAAQIALFTLRPWLIVSVVVSGAISAFYFLRLPLIERRIKELPGGKAVVLPLVMAGLFMAFHPSLPPVTARSALALAATLLLCHVNLMLYDLKDVAQDRAAGITSLAAALPRALFLRLEAALCLTGAALAAALGGPLGLCLAAGFGVLLLAIWRLRRHRFDLALCAGIDGGLGAAFVVGLLWIAL